MSKVKSHFPIKNKQPKKNLSHVSTQKEPRGVCLWGPTGLRDLKAYITSNQNQNTIVALNGVIRASSKGRI